MNEEKKEHRIDGVKAGKRDGIHKRDINLYNLIRNSGFNMKYVAEKLYGSSDKKQVVKLYQRLYNFHSIGDEELEKLREVLYQMVTSADKLLKESYKVSERKRKLRIIMESGDSERLNEILDNMKD